MYTVFLNTTALCKLVLSPARCFDRERARRAKEPRQRRAAFLRLCGRNPGAAAERALAPGLQGQARGHGVGVRAPGGSWGSPPPGALLPRPLRVGADHRGPPRGAPARTRGPRGPRHRTGAAGPGRPGAGAGAARGSLSPRCELIIQMRGPGSGDWRPAPARRAISPGAHVTAALVGSAVHSSSLSTPARPAPRRAPAASPQLRTASLGRRGAAGERDGRGPPTAGAAGTGARAGPPRIPSPLLPRLLPPPPPPPTSRYRLRPAPGERGSGARRRGASGREGTVP